MTPEPHTSPCLPLQDFLHNHLPELKRGLEVAERELCHFRDASAMAEKQQDALLIEVKGLRNDVSEAMARLAFWSGGKAAILWGTGTGATFLGLYLAYLKLLS